MKDINHIIPFVMEDMMHMSSCERKLKLVRGEMRAKLFKHTYVYLYVITKVYLYVITNTHVYLYVITNMTDLF